MSNLLSRQVRSVILHFKGKDSWSISTTSVVLFYLVATVSFITGILTSKEWSTGAVSLLFLTSVVILPFVSVALAFGIQIISLMTEGRKRERFLRQQSRFIAGIDKCHSGSMTRQAFLNHLLEEWGNSMERVSEGTITIQRGFWKVCSQLYDVAKTGVEVTSTVPLTYWSDDEKIGNHELKEYESAQILKLISNKIPVRRTFILTSIPTGAELKLFFDIVLRQLEKGFAVYYIDLSSVQEQEREVLSKDFSLIDNTVLMLGTHSGDNQAVYYYDLYEIPSFHQNKARRNLFLPALRLFCDEIDLNPSNLLVTKRGKRINELPCLEDDQFRAERTAIQARCAAVTGWRR